MKHVVSIAAAAAIALAVAGCGDDKADGPEVSDAWARTSPMAVDVGAAYLHITSPIDDQLVAVTVDADIAGTVEIHETVAAADTASTMTTTMGTTETSEPGGQTGVGMTMRPVEALDLPADEEVVLEPGGYHIMLLELPAPLETGTEFDATLEFAESDPMTITFEVREEAP